jgi:hypothetical protein
MLVQWLGILVAALSVGRTFQTYEQHPLGCADPSDPDTIARLAHDRTDRFLQGSMLDASDSNRTGITVGAVDLLRFGIEYRIPRSRNPD